MGSGLNLPFYDPQQVEQVLGLEPSGEMRRRAARRARRVDFDVQFIDLPGEEIPLDDASIDTVLVTYALCTIPDVERALQQMRRVLKPGGELIFCEHGLAPDEGVARWQARINPLWHRLAGGCNLNRDVPALIRGAGFAIGELDTMYLPRVPRFAGFNYWGVATRA